MSLPSTQDVIKHSIPPKFSRILIASDILPSSGPNGVATLISMIADSLRERQYAVDLLEENMELLCHFDRLLAWKTKRRLQKMKPDYILSFNDFSVIGRTLLKYAKEKQYPVVTTFATNHAESNMLYHPDKTIHQLNIKMWKDKLYSFHNQDAVAKIIVNCEQSRKELERANYSPNKLAVVPLGVKTTRFNPLKRDDAYLDRLIRENRTPSDSPIERPYLLSVGRLVAEKRVTHFLDSEVPGTKIVVGNGGPEEELKAKYRHNPAIVFLGAKRGEDLAKIYASCDIFAFPSVCDTFGLVQIEALASGLPVVVYEHPRTEIVQNDSEFGQVCFRGKQFSEALQHAIRAVTASPETREDFRNRCTNYAQKYFSWERYMDDLLSVLSCARIDNAD